MSSIYERLKKVVTDRLGVEPEQVIPAASLTKDLGADSIEMVELVMSIEDEFSDLSRALQIPDEDMEKMATIQDTVDYLRGLGIKDY